MVGDSFAVKCLFSPDTQGYLSPGMCAALILFVFQDSRNQSWASHTNDILDPID